MSNCGLCGEPMPAGEEMFTYHGYSGPCPKPPKPNEAIEYSIDRLKKMAKCVYIAADKVVADDIAGGLLWAVDRIEKSHQVANITKSEVFDLVKAAIGLAITRHNLGTCDGELTRDEKLIQEIATDTWNAMQGIDTCSDMPIKELLPFARCE